MNTYEEIQMKENKCTSMFFLHRLTKGNSKMIMEMVKVYLEETPKFLNKMKDGINSMDWDTVARAAHSLIPSFSTMGIDKKFAVMTKRINEYAENREHPEIIKELFCEIEQICLQARKELEEELVLLKKINNV